MKRLFVTADDLGRGVETNVAIERCVQRGIVTGCSLIANGSAVGDARARKGSVGAIGLHLNLTEGKALTGPIRGLTDARGTFKGPIRAMIATLFGRVDLDRVRRELEAQCARALELGFTLVAIDGHHHAHVFPGVFPLVAEIAIRHGIRVVRMPHEPALTGHPGARAKRAVLSTLCGEAAPIAAQVGLDTPEHFRGLSLYGRRSDHRSHLLRVLERLPEGDTELMVHPRAGILGEHECGSLTDVVVRATLDRHRVTLATLRDL